MTVDDYKKILYTMFPPGPLWPHQEGEAPVWDTWISAVAQEAARVDDAAQEMINEAIPDATGYAYPSVLLEKWEQLAGLDGTGTDEERVQALIAQLRRRGNPTLALFESAAGELETDVVAIDGWRLVDSIDLPWNETGTVDVTYNAVPDPDGGTAATVVFFDAVSDAIDADILRIADYESVYVSFRIRLAGGGTHTLDIDFTGRDGASKYSDTITVTGSWARYDFAVDDVGTGGSDPNLAVSLASGVDVTIHLYDVKAGWRELYFPAFGAGSVCTDPSAPEWCHVWGLEYGEDQTDRSGNEPNWQVVTVTANYAQEPISRDQLAERLVFSGAQTARCDFDADDDETVHVSFWLRCTTADSFTVRVRGRETVANYIYDETIIAETWTKIEVVGNVSSGAQTPRIYIVSTGALEIWVSHVRVSVVNETLENQTENTSPLHTSVVFLSYGELSETGE